MTLIPPVFLFRLAYPCPFQKEIPHQEGDSLLELPPNCRVDDRARLREQPYFADVRLAWNEQGLGVQWEVRGKDQPLVADVSRPRSSDGFSLWLDTRDTRDIHRASKYCHHFWFLPTGGGPDLDEPAAGQLKINRALQDAPHTNVGQILLRKENVRGGYRMEVFLPAATMHGFDPEVNRRLGFFYVVRDSELGEQTLGLGPEFPFWEDPSLWSTLELVG